MGLKVFSYHMRSCCAYQSWNQILFLVISHNVEVDIKKTTRKQFYKRYVFSLEKDGNTNVFQLMDLGKGSLLMGSGFCHFPGNVKFSDKKSTKYFDFMASRTKITFSKQKTLYHTFKTQETMALLMLRSVHYHSNKLERSLL